MRVISAPKAWNAWNWNCRGTSWDLTDSTNSVLPNHQLPSRLSFKAYFCSDQLFHGLSSCFTRRLGVYHVQSHRFPSRLESGTVFQHHDIFSRLAGEKCFHSRNHGNLQWNPRAVSANVGCKRPHPKQFGVASEKVLLLVIAHECT